MRRGDLICELVHRTEPGDAETSVVNTQGKSEDGIAELLARLSVSDLAAEGCGKNDIAQEFCGGECFEMGHCHSWESRNVRRRYMVVHDIVRW